MPIVVRLPYPPKELMPNKAKGTHWTTLHSLRDQQRLAGKLCTQAALQTSGPQEWPERIPVSLLYLAPKKRMGADLDGLLSASKHILDGMADALGVDDKRFGPLLIEKALGDGEGCLIAAVGVRIESAVALP
jgi:crossover junction endodeoxyribonuclease RusA